MNKKGIPLFSYRQIEVKLDYSWFIIFFLIVITLGMYYFPHYYASMSPVVRWSISVISALLLFISVLLHEFSHSLVAQKLGIEINSIVLFVFGGVAQMKSEPEDPKSEFYISVAGPLCSLVLGILFMGIYYIFPNQMHEAIGAVFWYIGYLNLALVAFNILPGFPLDGGRIARAAIWYYTDNLRKATRIVSNIGKFLAFLIIGFGLLNMLVGAFIQGLFFVFLGMFLQQASVRGYQMVALREGLAKVNVSRIMTPDPHTVPDDITLQTLIDDYFYKYKVHSFPVIKNEEPVGLVTVKSVKSVPRESWDSTLVVDIMDPLNATNTLSPDDDAYEILIRMIENNVGRMPVISDHKVRGIITRKDIMEFVLMREEIEA